MSHRNPPQTPTFHAANIVWLMWAVLVVVLAIIELPAWLDEASRAQRLEGWLSGLHADGLPFIAFVIAFPVTAYVGGGLRRSKHKEDLDGEPPETDRRERVLAWMAAGIVFLTAYAVSHYWGHSDDDLPPAYHDEYSYRFQAETFLLGRWSVPSFRPHSEMFDQMHVLNNGEFASRYFPGTGMWMAPWLALGNPWVGHRFAQAFCAMMVVWIGRELANARTGFIAGLLFALSPGLILFSNLLLAHHPTLVGLSVFLWAFLKLMRRNAENERTARLIFAAIAGIGLAFAMLCRPMTAAAFALPFGISFLGWVATGCWTPRRRTERDNGNSIDGSSEPATVASHLRWQRLQVVAAMGMPLLCGFAVIAWQDLAITGHLLKTPYGLYNEMYTPRHIYGFGNVTRGSAQLASESLPDVSRRYDEWARDLGMSLAAANMQSRLRESLRWSLGIVPLAIAATVMPCTMRRSDSRWWLIIASIVSLHLAHIPYWFAGIFGWHYVFESAPLLLLLFAEATRKIVLICRRSGHTLTITCWLLLTVLAVVINLQTVVPLWPSRLERGFAEVGYPRQIYAQFRRQADAARNDVPAIIFVIPDSDDVSMDFVTNSPLLNTEVLTARVPDLDTAELRAELFPNRLPFVFDAKSRTMRQLQHHQQAQRVDQ